ncbi:PAS domain-containing protein, partial [Klebsiella pneumoniae]|uniref:PAS domain-containing protein n=1 Tax=Klebsiella pneumoniae TaxID=573 RepID=UPI0037BF8722
LTGIDLLKEAAAQQFDIPIILLTGVGNRDIDILAMKSGATDYLVKSDLSSEKMERCIRHALERKNFAEELKIRETRYRKLFEGSRDAVFITDTDLNFKEVNQSSLLLLEPGNGTLHGRNLLDFIDDQIHRARILDVVKTSGK